MSLFSLEDSKLASRQLHTTHTGHDMMVKIMERLPLSTLPEAEIAESFSAVMLAGFHTTQNALCAAIYFILTHLDTKGNLMAELDSVYASPDEVDGRITKMPYLNAVITEALHIPSRACRRVSPGVYVDGVYTSAGVSSYPLYSYICLY